MFGRLIAAGALAVVLAPAVLSSPALAETATSDLIPEPPVGSWAPYPAGTHAETAQDIYGSQAGSVKGFRDAFLKSWIQPNETLLDRLEHFSSALWAAFRFGESEGAAKRNTSHTSYATVPGFGNGAYEVTNPPDSLGFRQDVFVFTAGDYVALIIVAAKDTPDHGALMDQARRQLAQIPIPVNEYNAIGSGFLTTLAIVAGIVGAAAVAAAAIVLFIVIRGRRSRSTPAPASGGALRLSTDRRYWWDGQAWQDASARVPPGVSMSPDGSYWWDGATWRPTPPTWRR